MENIVKNTLLLMCGVVIGGSIAITYYSKQMEAQIMEGLKRDVDSSDRHLKHVANVYHDFLEASEEGEDAMLREAYYGFGILSDQLDEQKKAKFQGKHIEFLTADCEDNIYKSCVYLGEHYINKEQYDKALPLLLKSANNSSLKAMSLLVDIYRVKSWSQANEETAKYWMMKLGKNG